MTADATGSPDTSAEQGGTSEGGVARQRVVLVAAVADNGVIGRDNEIPWRIPEDMRHFRATTTGHAVVMGRLTFESLGRPLPDRTNIVVSRRPDWTADGATVVGSLDEALEAAREVPGDVMVIGGAQIYAAAMPVADVQVLTEVHQSPDGDTYYPEFDRAQWREVRREERDGHAWVWLERSST